MKLAPIVLFTYKRLWHTRQTVEALQRNELAETSELFVYSDGPKFEADREKVQEVRDYLKTISGFKNVTLIERDKNLGLTPSIIAGVTEIVNRYGRIIVLEDDLVTSRYFLRFMNEALELYRDEERVISAHGYLYPVKGKLPETFFLRGADCWGWATWKRGWALFESDGQKLMDELKERDLIHEFNFDGCFNYTKMLKYQIQGKISSWDIMWYASAFLRNRLTLYPGSSLVCNIGNDGSGTHRLNNDEFLAGLTETPVSMKAIPVEADPFCRKEIGHFLRDSDSSFLKSIIRRLKKMAVGITHHD